MTFVVSHFCLCYVITIKQSSTAAAHHHTKTIPSSFNLRFSGFKVKPRFTITWRQSLSDKHLQMIRQIDSVMLDGQEAMVADRKSQFHLKDVLSAKAVAYYRQPKLLQVSEDPRQVAVHSAGDLRTRLVLHEYLAMTYASESCQVIGKSERLASPKNRQVLLNHFMYRYSLSFLHNYSTIAWLTPPRVTRFLLPHSGTTASPEPWRRLRGDGPPKNLRWEDGPCIRPQYFEKYCYRM